METLKQIKEKLDKGFAERNQGELWSKWNPEGLQIQAENIFNQCLETGEDIDIYVKIVLEL